MKVCETCFYCYNLLLECEFSVYHGVTFGLQLRNNKLLTIDRLRDKNGSLAATIDRLVSLAQDVNIFILVHYK